MIKIMVIVIAASAACSADRSPCDRVMARRDACAQQAYVMCHGTFDEVECASYYAMECAGTDPFGVVCAEEEDACVDRLTSVSVDPLGQSTRGPEYVPAPCQALWGPGGR